jgi:hypothetical protein
MDISGVSSTRQLASQNLYTSDGTDSGFAVALSQALASTDSSSRVNSAGPSDAEQAAAAQRQELLDKLQDYAGKDTGSTLRAMILGQMGLTEDDLKAMTPEDRAKIEEKIVVRIKELLQQGDLLSAGSDDSSQQSAQEYANATSPARQALGRQLSASEIATLQVALSHQSTSS